MKWTEASIRAELARLDEKTGLNGSALPISFGNAQFTLGRYSPSGGGSFRFSNYYFEDPEFPDEQAIDVIRHEYAHYLDYKKYGHVGHGRSWKLCCEIVGAAPRRCYDEDRARYYQRKHAEKARLTERFDRYMVGDSIDHPQWGGGVIERITGEAVNRCVEIAFDSVGRKKLALFWVDKNCKRSS